MVERTEAERSEKKFGIQGTLAQGNPMANAHLLGDQWQWFRWYATETERDQAWQEMSRKHPHYRIGDHPNQILSKVERD